MTTFKDMNLQVGARLQMTLERGGVKPPVYYTDLIGYVDKEYLIVKTPFEKGLSVQINQDELVTLRILAGVDVYTLSCRVRTVFRSPHHYLHLSFPIDIKSITLRSAIRAKVNLPVQINGEADSGLITDISVTGAAITGNKVIGDLNTEVSIAFDFPIKPTKQNVHIETGATIRSMQQLPAKTKDAPPKYTHGVSFHSLDLTSQVMLLNLVYESINGF